LVFCGVPTRQSTAQAVIRTTNIVMESSGQWSFEVRAEQKSCHFAKPPATAERVSYLVVEAGVSTSGWQAGVTRTHDGEWHRLSLLRLMDDLNSAPVVVSHVQNYDSRAEFVATRHHLVPAPLPADDASTQEPYQAFFVQVQGVRVWCQDMHYYAEYFDNIDLAGTPVAALCELSIPDWHWHSCCSGVPPAMKGPDKTPFFSARWTIRIHTSEETTFRLSSLASGGSRVMLDDATVLDAWENWGSTFTSDPVPTGAGYHYLVYEYRSADSSSDAAPANSYAVLTWVHEGGLTVDGSTIYAEAVTSEAKLYADVGWLACAPGAGVMHGQQLEAGFAPATSGSTTSVNFGVRFGAVPIVLSTIFSTGKLSAHLRLLEASEEQVSMATEYDTCNFVIHASDHVLAWIATALPKAIHGALESVASPRLTRSLDVAALLSIRASLGLPDYLLWRNGSDPCSDRWAGVECRVVPGEDPRVVVLDVRAALFLNCSQDHNCWRSFHTDYIVLRAARRCTTWT
jgi:hypothetical protein